MEPFHILHTAAQLRGCDRMTFLIVVFTRRFSLLNAYIPPCDVTLIQW